MFIFEKITPTRSSKLFILWVVLSLVITIKQISESIFWFEWFGCGAVRDESDDEKKKNEEEKDTLSDLDDEELNVYLNTPQEIERKTIVWNEIYKDYLQKQAGLFSLILIHSISLFFNIHLFLSFSVSRIWLELLHQTEKERERLALIAQGKGSSNEKVFLQITTESPHTWNKLQHCELNLQMNV